MGHIHELIDFTTSAYILHPTLPKIVLLKHRKLGVWLQPGGHIELNENPLQALSHELEEEAGLKPSDYVIIEPADHPNPKGSHGVLPLPFYIFQHDFNETHQHIDLTYLVKSKTTKLTDNPDGADDIGWFSLEEIKSFHHVGDLYKETLEVIEWIFEHKF